MKKVAGLILLISIHLFSFGQIEIPSITNYFYGFDNWFDLMDSNQVEKVIQKSNRIKSVVIFDLSKTNKIEVKIIRKRFLRKDRYNDNIFYFDDSGKLVKYRYSEQVKMGQKPISSPTVQLRYDTISKNTIRLKAESLNKTPYFLEIRNDYSNQERTIKSLEVDSSGNIITGGILIITRYDTSGRTIYEKMTRNKTDGKYIDEFKIYYDNSFLPTSEERSFYGYSKYGDYTNQYSVDYLYNLDDNGNWTKKVIENNSTGKKEVRKRKIYYKKNVAQYEAISKTLQIMLVAIIEK